MYNIVSSQGTVKYCDVLLTPLLSPLDRNNGVMLSQYHLTSSEPGPRSTLLPSSEENTEPATEEES